MVTDTWRNFYEERDYDRCAYLEGEDMVDYAELLFESVGVPDTVASVGCGPAVVEFELADRYPETEFRCFDVADRIVADNRDLARGRGLDNLEFEVAALPDAELGGSYDLVYCVATLYFVADVERALRTLFEAVEPGEYLVVSYPDRRLQGWVEEQGEEKREFFELVADGRNLLTRDEVEEVLGVETRDYWDLGDDPPERTGTVYARRPASAG
jgi:trans-aconitate methyltransferase